MSTETDTELMQRFVDGDEAAYEELITRYRGPLVGFLHKLVWDHGLAEDMAQEVFCKLFVHRHQFNPSGSFRSWLYRIAKNLWIDKCRKDGRRPQTLSLNRPTDGAEGEAFIDRVVDPYRTPQTAFDRGELMNAIQSAVQALPDEQQLVFHLSESQGLKYTEIATVLDIPVGTVKSRMHLAVKKLKGMLGGLRAARKVGQ